MKSFLKPRCWWVAVFFMGCPALGWCTALDGTLDVLVTPNVGKPALVGVGGTFEVFLGEKGALSLRSGEGAHALEVSWRAEGGGVLARCRIPDSVPAGTYNLAFEEGDTKDTNVRSVYVYAGFPESYIVAHGGGVNGTDGDLSMEKFVGELNESHAAFALVTGPLTKGGTAEEYSAVVKSLEASRVPVFVVGGRADGREGLFESYFGPQDYAFWFGLDGYLAFDTGQRVPADSLGGSAGRLESLRRGIKAARWSVGFSHRYEASMDMRSQLVLFVDNPLDFLLVSRGPRPETREGFGLPWGGIPCLPALRGEPRFMEVTAAGPEAAAVEK